MFAVPQAFAALKHLGERGLATIRDDVSTAASEAVGNMIEKVAAKGNVAVQHIANQGGVAVAEGFWSAPKTRQMMLLVGGGLLVVVVLVVVVLRRR